MKYVISYLSPKNINNFLKEGGILFLISPCIKIFIGKMKLFYFCMTNN